MRGWRRILAIAGAVTLSLVAGFALWVRSLLWFPDDVEPVDVTCDSAQELPVGKPIKVLMWNVQYGASRVPHFWYDGGQDVSVRPEYVERTLDRIAEVVREHDPDVILWQELDRDSRRTGFVDQYAELLARTPYPCHCATPYHKVGYVPAPGHEPLGKVDMELGVFSKYALGAATRVQLPLLDEPWWRQAFNLRRALLEVEMPVAGGGTFTAFNTHLSAFSKGDGTLDKQIRVLHDAMTARETAKQPWLLGGDLNSLPPGDDPARLGDEGVEAYSVPTPVKVLFDRFTSAMPLRGMEMEPARWFTYLPWGADALDRTIDYVFVGRRVTVRDVQVLQELDVSDHMPILVEMVIEPETP